MSYSYKDNEVRKQLMNIGGMVEGTYNLTHDDVREMLKLGIIIEEKFENLNILPKELEKIPQNEWTIILS